MTSPADRRVALTFMAHPDDAEILCGGTLIRLAEVGWEVHIATATAGDCGTTSETPWAISHRRTEEAKQAAATDRGDVSLPRRTRRFHHLRSTDAPQMHRFVPARSPRRWFSRCAPRDYMVDHEMASLLARSSSFVYAVPNISVAAEGAGSRVPYLYYCDPVDGIDPLGNPVTPTTVIDITAQLEKKSAMLACHASQREWLRALPRDGRVS